MSSRENRVVARNAGFTLWELVWTIAIAGITLGLAVPSFEAFLLDSRRTADINAFVIAVQLARSEAAKRGRPIVLCQSPDLIRCGNDELDYGSGWIVFANDDEMRPPQRAAQEPILYAHAPELVGSISANRELFEFRPYLKRSVNGTATFCDRRGASAARAVIVSYTGRPRVDSKGPAGERLVCARLP
jgi:type IV fimbrial biogenesis protein FimT